MRSKGRAIKDRDKARARDALRAERRGIEGREEDVDQAGRDIDTTDPIEFSPLTEGSQGEPQNQEKDVGELPLTFEGRKQGRPATTGDYGRKKEVMARKVEEDEERKVQEILDPLTKPFLTKLYTSLLNQIKEKEDKSEHSSIAGLEAMVFERTIDLYKVAVGSGKLQGPIIKMAKEAAAEMCATVTILAIKAQNPQEVPIDRQLRELRQQMLQLRMENEQLRKMLEKRRKGKLHTMEREKEELEITSKKPLSEEAILAKERTRKWVDGSSPPPVGGEAPTTHGRTGEVPPPSMGGRTSSVGENEGTEEMDVDGKEYGFREEDFPPIKPKRIAPGQTSGTLPISQGGTQVVIPSGRKGISTKEEENERDREISLIAKLEGIVERLLDKRLGDPIPSYGERKEAEKAVQQQQQQRKSNPPPSQPKAGTKPALAKERTASGTSGKPVIKSIDVPKKAIKILPATTLNPPARPATTRILKTGKGANAGKGGGDDRTPIAKGEDNSRGGRRISCNKRSNSRRPPRPLGQRWCRVEQRR